jgi:hypothetical protein
MTIKDLITRLAGLFPRAFADEVQLQAWEDTYQEALGHLKPDQLAAAFKSAMQQWEKSTPPMPRFILAQVANSGAYGGPSGASDPKSMKAMAEALPGLVGDLMGEWWKANAHWFDQECEARLLTEDKIRTVRFFMNSTLRKRAHFQAQINFRSDKDAPVTLSQDDIESVFSFAVPQTTTQWKQAHAKKLADLARKSIERGRERRDQQPSAPPPPARDPSGPQERDGLEEVLDDLARPDARDDEDAA